jgi:uncharacterized protein YbjT (DUF2867 family)
MRIFVAGGTGYVGSRLVPRLLRRGHEVVVLTRDRDRARRRPWADDVAIVQGDVEDSRAVTAAAFDADVLVDLVHGMETGVADFAAAERRGAKALAGAAMLAGVEHVVYLGGLVDEDDALSPHMASRLETGRVLADAGPPVTELRASIVIGAGSASYELVRFVAQAPFPVLLHPHWAEGRCQPVALPDLLDVLVDVVEGGPSGQHHVVEVAGPEQGGYHDLVDLLRAVRGLPPTIQAAVPTVTPPVLTGELLAQLTPLDPATVGPLVASLAVDSVVTGHHDARVGPTDVATALRASLDGRGEYATMPGDPDWVGATLDLDTVLTLLQRLPDLPRRFLPRLDKARVLGVAVDAVNAFRRA